MGHPNVRITGGDQNGYSAALESHHNMKAGPGQLYHAHVTNSDTQDLWLLVVDKATSAIDDDLAMMACLVPQGTNNGFDFFTPVPFTLGLQLVVSTTMAKVTIPVAAKSWFFANFS
jgi:hypothetical protein